MESIVWKPYIIFVFWNTDASSFDLFFIDLTICHELCGNFQLYDDKQKLPESQNELV